MRLLLFRGLEYLLIPPAVAAWLLMGVGAVMMGAVSQLEEWLVLYVSPRKTGYD